METEMLIQEKSHYLQCMVYANDGKTFVSGGGDNKVRIWRAGEEKEEEAEEDEREGKGKEQERKESEGKEEKRIEKGKEEGCTIF